MLTDSFLQNPQENVETTNKFYHSVTDEKAADEFSQHQYPREQK